MKDHLVIFDTTLRDGEQSPGASMTKEEKIRIAKQLEKLQVDVIEAGFPAASQGDFESVQAVASVVKDSTICGLARAVENDIVKAGEAIKSANSGRIHTFIATSPIHMEKKLRMSPDEVVERAVWAVKKARNFTDDVEFSPEDAGRSEVDFLCRVIEAVIDAGATTINIPDTVGYNVPHQFGNLFKELIERIPNSDKAIFSAHCHNDLGLATANLIAGVINGARQIDCIINGIGERAGNCSLEEAVRAIKTRSEFFEVEPGIDTTRLYPTSRLVSSIIGMHTPRNKAIVGENAFSHEAGIHQHGMLQHASTYEIMLPEDVGLSKSNLVLGKHSGRHAVRDRAQQLSFELIFIFTRFTKLHCSDMCLGRNFSDFAHHFYFGCTLI